MNSPKPDAAQPVDSSSSGLAFLLAVEVTVGLTLLGLCVIAWVCAYTVPPRVHDAAFLAQFTVLERYFYAEQPAKSAAFQAGCLAAPFLLAASYWVALRWMRQLSPRQLNRCARIGLSLYFVVVLSSGFSILYCPHPPVWFFPPAWILLPINFSHPFYKPIRLLAIAVGLFIEYRLLTNRPSRQDANRVAVLLLILSVFIIPSRFYVPVEMSDDRGYLYHLNSVLDALSQSTNGHHLLVDFPHIYGGYVEVLAVFINLLPRAVGSLIAALAIPNVIGIFCQLIAVWLLVRRPAILFLCALTLLGIACLSSAEDLNYGYLTARMFTGPVGILLATLYFRQSSMARYVAMTVWAAFASIWNLDTGVALWVSWTATLAVTAAASRSLLSVARHLLLQAITLALAWLSFFVYLRLASGRWPDFGLLFYFQKIVLGAGYFCLPLVIPDTWMSILLVYLITLALVLVTSLRGEVGWKTPMMLMLAIFGLGIFGYFMGRSVPTNLVAVSYPAVFLAGMLCSDGETWMQRGKLPPLTRFFLLPFRIAMCWWAFLTVAALSDIFRHSLHVATQWNDSAPTPFRANVAFITHQVRPHDPSVFFLSNHSGYYYYLSDTVRPLRIPGMIELLRTSDMETLIDAIQHRQINKLFLEQNFYDIFMYRPDIYDRITAAVHDNYRVAAVGPTGKLVLYAPK